MKYQPGLETTKSWLKTHSKVEIEQICKEAGLSTQKLQIILKVYCEERPRDFAADETGASVSTFSRKKTEALYKISSVLRFLGLID